MKRNYLIIAGDEFAHPVDYVYLEQILSEHPYSKINYELYKLMFKYTLKKEGLQFIFEVIYSCCTMAFLDKHPEILYSRIFKNGNTKSENFLCLIFVYALLSIRDNNTERINFFIEILEERLTSDLEDEKLRLLFDNVKAWVKEQPLTKIDFTPSGLNLELWNSDILYMSKSFNNHHPECIDTTFCEHLLRCAKTKEEQIEAYNVIEKNLNLLYENDDLDESVKTKMRRHFNIKPNWDNFEYNEFLPYNWKEEIYSGTFGNYLTLGATDLVLEKVPTEEEYNELFQECENSRKEVCEFMQELMDYVNIVKPLKKISDEQWDNIWRLICEKDSKLIFGERKKHILYNKRLNYKNICHIIGQFKSYLFPDHVTQEELASSLQKGMAAFETFKRYIAGGMKDIDSKDAPEIIRKIFIEVLKQNVYI